MHFGSTGLGGDIECSGTSVCSLAECKNKNCTKESPIFLPVPRLSTSQRSGPQVRWEGACSGVRRVVVLRKHDTYCCYVSQCTYDLSLGPIFTYWLLIADLYLRLYWPVLGPIFTLSCVLVSMLRSLLSAAKCACPWGPSLDYIMRYILLYCCRRTEHMFLLLN